ncbi:UNVERIFIED_CONTAM: hypothetical protein Cloal_1872 [Acetivibrio alkalicellulosi]
MKVKLIRKNELLEDYNRHYVSEKNIRIEVVEVTQNSKNVTRFYDIHKGELLIISLKGSGKVITPEAEIVFEEHDQVFINNDTPFRIESDSKTLIELVWSPGLIK